MRVFFVQTWDFRKMYVLVWKNTRQWLSCWDVSIFSGAHCVKGWEDCGSFVKHAMPSCHLFAITTKLGETLQS